jgi:hypothetical protein
MPGPNRVARSIPVDGAFCPLVPSSVAMTAAIRGAAHGYRLAVHYASFHVGASDLCGTWFELRTSGDGGFERVRAMGSDAIDRAPSKVVAPIPTVDRSCPTGGDVGRTDRSVDSWIRGFVMSRARVS